MLELINFIIQHFLQGVILNMLFGLIMIVKLIMLGISSISICQQIVEEPGFKNVKNKHFGMSPF